MSPFVARKKQTKARGAFAPGMVALAKITIIKTKTCC